MIVWQNGVCHVNVYQEKLYHLSPACRKKIALTENYQCLQNIYSKQTLIVSIVRWCVICFSSCDIDVYNELYLQMWYASSSWERCMISGVTIDIWKKNSVL